MNCPAVIAVAKRMNHRLYLHARQDRLEVLGRAQGLLFRAKTDGGRVTFDELINAELVTQSVRVAENGLITLDGPKGVGLRYGTVPMRLKQPNGHFTVRWRLETLGEKGASPGFISNWKESGVQPPPLGASPQGTGQGRELIERVLPINLMRKRCLPWRRMVSIALFRFPPLNMK